MKKLLENKKMLAILGGSAAAVVLTAVLLVYNLVILPNQRYEAATKLFAEGNYAEAYEAIQKVPEKKNDTETLLPYYDAYADFSAGDYASAAQKFEAAGEYEDSVPMAGYCRAVELMEQKKYSEAYGEFAALGEFRDSQDMLKECPYRVAEDLLASGSYEEALSRFKVLSGYKDSDAKGQECSYQLASAALERKEYGDAYNAFLALGDYGNSKEMLSECRYRMAGDLMAAGDLAGALERYDALAGYKDSADQAKECRYQQAAALAAQQTVDAMTQAQELYGQLGDYKDAAAQVTTLAAAIEEASRVPYTPSSEAFFDIDCTDPAYIRFKPYRAAVLTDGNGTKIFTIPSGIGTVSKISSDLKYYTIGPGGSYTQHGHFQNVLTASGGTINSGEIIWKDSWKDSNSFKTEPNSGTARTYSVDGTWEEGAGWYWYSGSDKEKVNVSAVRFQEMAVSLSKTDQKKSVHSEFIRKIQYGRTKSDFDGMVGGAIIFGEYDYMDLGYLRFKEVEGTQMTLTNGVILSVQTSCAGGDVTETYRGMDIYTKDNGAYIRVTRDVYIWCGAYNAAQARQTLRELIDNYHHL